MCYDKNMDNKLIIKNIIKSIVVILAVITVVEVISFMMLKSNDKNFHYSFGGRSFDSSYKSGEFYKNFRPVENITDKRGSIILFGSDMACGVGVKDDQTMSHILAKLSGRTIYNRAIPVWGLQHMYYQLTNDSFPSKINVDPEYIIYTVAPDNYNRLFFDSSTNDPYYLTYSVKDGKLVKNKDSVFNRFLAVCLSKQMQAKNNYDENLIDFYILESQKAAKKLYPNVKFVVLSFSNIDGLNNDDILTDNGIQVIDVPETSGTQPIYKLKEYWADDSAHPSEKYWYLVLPSVIKKLK